MSIEVKPRRWRTRGGSEAIVEDNESGRDLWPWRGQLATGGRMTWASDGRYALTEGLSDLVEYLGPLPDATPAPKRYWLFAGNDYYATGGMHDFRDCFDSVEEAETSAKKLDCDEWFHVVDITTGQIVAGTKYQAYGAPQLTPEQIGGVQ